MSYYRQYIKDIRRINKLSIVVLCDDFSYLQS